MHEQNSGSGYTEKPKKSTSGQQQQQQQQQQVAHQDLPISGALLPQQQQQQSRIGVGASADAVALETARAVAARAGISQLYAPEAERATIVPTFAARAAAATAEVPIELSARQGFIQHLQHKKEPAPDLMEASPASKRPEPDDSDENSEPPASTEGEQPTNAAPSKPTTSKKYRTETGPNKT